MHIGGAGGAFCVRATLLRGLRGSVALDGVCTLWSASGEREVAAIDFITGPGTTVLEPGELLRSIRMGVEPPRIALRQFSLTPIGRSAALVIGAPIPSC